LSAPRSGVSSSAPPSRLFASPTEVTVTSTRLPLWANGGRLAVTMTAAALRLCTWSIGTYMPNCASMFEIDWRVARLREESPVPASPVTRP
jgi:hypothetical protein